MWLLVRIHRLLGSPLRRDVLPWLVRLVAAVALSTTILFATRVSLPADLTDNRVAGAITLVLLLFSYVVGLALVLRAFRFFTPRDLATLRRVLPRRLRPIAHATAIEFLFAAPRQRLASS
jgi:hypothetical protein